MYLLACDEVENMQSRIPANIPHSQKTRSDVRRLFSGRLLQASPVKRSRSVLKGTHHAQPESGHQKPMRIFPAVRYIDLPKTSPTPRRRPPSLTYASRIARWALSVTSSNRARPILLLMSTSIKSTSSAVGLHYKHPVWRAGRMESENPRIHHGDYRVYIASSSNMGIQLFTSAGSFLVGCRWLLI